MFKDLAGAIWRRTPARLKRWGVRFTQPRFTVTAGAVITNTEGHVLLLHHRFRPGSGWGIPGGFIKRGEQPDQALRRELREEVGLEIQDVSLFRTRAFKEARQVEIVFRCRARGETQQLSFEIKRLAWFDPHDLPQELPRDQVELIKLAVADGAKTHD
ncbi:MAG: NUDIX domain-containing protein [bacterium]